MSLFQRGHSHLNGQALSTKYRMSSHIPGPFIQYGVYCHPAVFRHYYRWFTSVPTRIDMMVGSTLVERPTFTLLSFIGLHAMPDLL